MINIAVLGYGVVGSGVVEVIYKNPQAMEKKLGDTVEVKYILDKRDFEPFQYSDKIVKDFNIILNDPNISVVVEVMGGVEPAFTFAMESMKVGKSVVTSNKELVAAKGFELLDTAKKYNVNFLFEASVGGGIPIIRPLHQCLGANEIFEIAGILNGTTNFILTKMIKEGMDFAPALKMAQALGYAEADPTADVEGHDACRKICILASLAFGKHVYPENVFTQGITKITAEDVSYADSLNGVIKLIGRAKMLSNGKIAIMVTPAIVKRESQLSSVDDVFNGILVRGDATGDVVFYGRGAGKLPTASAVVADVLDVIKANGTINTLTWAQGDATLIEACDNYIVDAYIRIENGNDAKIKAILPNIIPISRINQPGEELAYRVSGITEGALELALEKITYSGADVLGMVRILDY